MRGATLVLCQHKNCGFCATILCNFKYIIIKQLHAFQASKIKRDGKKRHEFEISTAGADYVNVVRPPIRVAPLPGRSQMGPGASSAGRVSPRIRNKL